MKYVIYLDSGVEYLVSFPKNIDHDKMAEALEALRFGGRDWHRRQGEIVAAGFIEAGECQGKSETLGICSRKNVDTAVLRGGGTRKVVEQS